MKIKIDLSRPHWWQRTEEEWAIECAAAANETFWWAAATDYWKAHLNWIEGWAALNLPVMDN